MEQHISINESPLDDLEIKVTDDGATIDASHSARYIDHGPIFCKDSNNIFAKFGFIEQNFLPDSYCWWTEYLIPVSVHVVTLSLISSRHPNNGDFVKFLNALVTDKIIVEHQNETQVAVIDWLIIPAPSNRMIEVATKFGFTYECQQGERLILNCNEWRKRQGSTKGL